MNIVEKHKKLLKALEGKTVEAGWFASARYQASQDLDPKLVGVPVAKIARINEFGATTAGASRKVVIPARPFMREAVQKFKSERNGLQKRILRQYLHDDKMTADQALGQIGLAMENCIVDSIKNGKWEPNKPLPGKTMPAKGFNTPLIDTGQMWQAVTSKVVKSK